jgi:nicotinamide-nucleotide amidase
MNAPRAAVLSIGDELVLGTTLDTNGRTVSEALREAGLDVVEHRTVRDDRAAIAAAMRDLAASCDVLVSTGGLGPTDDDLTRDALNDLCDGGAPMVEDPQSRADLEAWFAGRGRAMAAINLRQAMRPRGARAIRNPGGTAPGLAARIGACRTWCLPGPPREMVPMLEGDVLPAVRPAGAPALAKCTVGTYGLGESSLAERLGVRMARDREPAVGTTASGSIVSIQVVARGPDAPRRAAEEAEACASIAAPYAFGTDGASLASALLDECRARRRTVTVAESCTGGLIGGMLTAVSGSSDCFPGGWITYSNALKTSEVGVAPEVLARHGAVSAETVASMAAGASTRAGATLGIAVSGIAGPGGAVEGKPVGTVWIAVHDAATGETRVRRFEFPGPRDIVRDRAAKAALQLARWTLRGEDAPLIWERA